MYISTLICFYFQKYDITAFAPHQMSTKGLEFAKNLRSLDQYIQKNERSEQILVTECFLTWSWRFLISNELEQSEFKLEKKYWD